MSDDGPMTDVTVATKPKEATKTRRVPPYNVILLNDDNHSMEFVIEVLSKALGYSVERCYQLMMQGAHLGPGRRLDRAEGSRRVEGRASSYLPREAATTAAISDPSAVRSSRRRVVDWRT